ncbi:MAG: SurA N-terminal domain-containing protein [Terracidiphilus sp.]|jgi:peptidyl-prolyl cis-trans isomerase SurA
MTLCGFALLAAVSGCHRSPSPDVMATVNSKDILRSDLEKYYNATLASNPQKPSSEQADIVRLNILKQMIDDEILWQRAARLNLTASDEDVNAKLTEMKTPYTQEEFDKQLKARNITLDDLKRDLRRSLTKTKLLNKEIESKINITDAEIGSYYASHKSEFNVIEPQYHLAQIAVTSGTDPQSGKATSDADARKKIQTLHDRLENGEDFGNLAVNFSENPNTAPNGGDMGFIPETRLRGDPDVYNAVSKLKPGEITGALPVFESNGSSSRTVGYAIYKLIAREPAGQRELNDPGVQQIIRQGIHDGHEQLLQNAYFEVLHDEAKIHNYFADQILKQGAQ